MTTPTTGAAELPEALRLAEQYDHGDPAAHGNAWKAAVCTELRRLHAENEALIGGLKKANEQAEHFEREWYLRGDEIEALSAAQAGVPAGQHPDDAAVDRFAAAMKEKLAAARAKGRSGWDDPEECSQERLSSMLRDHVAKGDPRDVANFCMFLWCRGEAIAPYEASNLDGQKYAAGFLQAKGYLPSLGQAFAAGAATAKTAQPAPAPTCKTCPGIPRPGCNYLAECGRVCNKCGQVHSSHLLELSTHAPAQVNTKTHDLLSTMIGLFLGAKDKIGYKPGSVIDKVVAEAVEHLKDWPYPEPAPAQPGQEGEREAIIRAAVAAMPYTNPLVADDLLEGHTMHTEADDIVAIWRAARAAPQPATEDALDAARYRWLRYGDNDEKALHNVPRTDYWFLLRGEKLDAAIDAALAAQREVKP